MIPAALLREPATLICLELAGTGGLVRHVAGGGAADGEGVGGPVNSMLLRLPTGFLEGLGGA